jgi:hypothetical protein
MVTNYPHPMNAREGLRPTASGARTGGLARLMTRVSQLVCGVRGHDTLLHFGDERISLRCASCDHETPGWELNEAPPTITVRGDARRHPLSHRQLIGARRVA